MTLSQITSTLIIKLNTFLDSHLCFFFLKTFQQEQEQRLVKVINKLNIEFVNFKNNTLYTNKRNKIVNMKKNPRSMSNHVSGGGIQLP